MEITFIFKVTLQRACYFLDMIIVLYILSQLIHSMVTGYFVFIMATRYLSLLLFDIKKCFNTAASILKYLSYFFNIKDIVKDLHWLAI